MNKFEVKDFQEKAIERVSFKLQNKKTVKLQSPTGSGKTLMTAKIVEQFLLENNWYFFKKTTIIYISLSSGSLDFQSYQKINNLITKKIVHGFSTQYIGTGSKDKNSNLKTKNYIQGINEFKKNTMYFMGWGILSANSKAFKEGEEDNIFSVIHRTKTSGTKILLIIDEAHRDNPLVETTKSTAKERLDFLNELAPERQLWLSATFSTLKKPITPDYIVRSDEVKAEGVIKQDIIVNANIDSSWDNDSINKKLISDAINKRLEIITSIDKSKESFNPLILIQIPDGNPKFRNINVNNYYLKLIDEVLNNYGLKKEFDYGVYLSNLKTNDKKEIEAMNSPLQAIVFKQAIATGWDVPRASILVKLRKPSTKTESFELQTLGRILRNPFLKVYKPGGRINAQDAFNLNNAFVFTNDKEYASFIKNEDEKDEDEVSLKKDYYQISSKAKKIKLKLDYLKINNHDLSLLERIDERSLIDSELTHNIFVQIEAFEKNIKTIAKAKSFDGASASEGILKVDSDPQLRLDSLDNLDAKEDLYFIYIQFLQAIKGSRIVEKIARQLAKKSNGKYKIKQIFRYFISEYNNVFQDEKTLKEIINNKLYELFKPFIEYQIKSQFTLANQIWYYKGNNEKIPVDFEQDTMFNSYLVNFKPSKEYKPIFDSKQEQVFYQWFKGWRWEDKEKKKIHLFRNNANPLDSYFIEYFDPSSMKVRKFFPDFILTTKNQIIILEIKGIGKHNIDIQAENKLKTISWAISKMQQNKKISIFKVGSIETPTNEDDLICYEYLSGIRKDKKNLDFLKEKILEN